MGVLCAALGAVVSADTLQLELEGDLGLLDPPSDASSAYDLLPVMLGITNLRYRLGQAEMDLESWQQSNDALAAHLQEREAHLTDLQVLVERQAVTIEILTRQRQAMQTLNRVIAADAAVADLTERSVSTPSVSGSRKFYAVPLDSPYIEGGMVVVIVVLLAWTLYLRGQVRNVHRETSDSVISSLRRPPARSAEVSVVAPTVPGRGKCETESRQERSAPSLMHNNHGLGAAPVSSIGPGPICEENGLTTPPS